MTGFCFNFSISQIRVTACCAGLACHLRRTGMLLQRLCWGTVDPPAYAFPLPLQIQFMQFMQAGDGSGSLYLMGKKNCLFWEISWCENA